MREGSKSFLDKLLSTDSPSGSEENIQKEWMGYVKSYVDDINTDTVGNVVATINPNKKFKVLIAGHCDEIGFIVRYIDENGYIYVAKSGGINIKLAQGKHVKILSKTGVIKGVIGTIAAHHGGAKDKLEIQDLYIDCGAKDKKSIEKLVEIGDYVIYDMGYEYLLDNRLTGRGLDNRTGAFIVAEVMRELSTKDIDVGVYGVSTVNEETNMGGAYFAASRLKPSMALVCDVTFATDYPGNDKRIHGDISLGKGPVLAKGAPINKKINEFLEKTAKRKEINIQYELTPTTTGTDGDKIRLTGEGVPIGLVSLPLRYMHSSAEVIDTKDITDIIQLIVDMIVNLSEEENLKPVN